MPLDVNFKPKTLREAVDHIVNNLNADEISEIKNTDYTLHHHFFGRHLRNAWGLWQKDTELVKWFHKNLGLGHADDMSGIILQHVWARVKEEYFDQDKCVAQYKEHWANLGIDALTQEKIQ